MRVNQLVKIWILPKKDKFLCLTHYEKPNIGVISRILKTRIEVRFSSECFMKFRPEQIHIVPTDHCETIPFSEFKRKSITNSFSGEARVIVSNEIKHYVGIGWVIEKFVENESDLLKYPRLVDDEEHRRLSLAKKFGV